MKGDISNMEALLGNITSLLFGGMTNFATGIGSALQSLVGGIFVSGAGTTSDPYTLTLFGGLVIIFGGLSLCFTLSRWVLNFVTSLGNRNR